MALSVTCTAVAARDQGDVDRASQPGQSLRGSSFELNGSPLLNCASFVGYTYVGCAVSENVVVDHDGRREFVNVHGMEVRSGAEHGDKVDDFPSVMVDGPRQLRPGVARTFPSDLDVASHADDGPPTITDDSIQVAATNQAVTLHRASGYYLVTGDEIDINDWDPPSRSAGITTQGADVVGLRIDGIGTGIWDHALDIGPTRYSYGTPTCGAPEAAAIVNNTYWRHLSQLGGSCRNPGWHSQAVNEGINITNVNQVGIDLPGSMNVGLQLTGDYEDGLKLYGSYGDAAIALTDQNGIAWNVGGRGRDAGFWYTGRQWSFGGSRQDPAVTSISRDGAVRTSGVVQPGVYDVAALPKTCRPGDEAYARNGLKSGEAPGRGSGTLVVCTFSSTSSSVPEWWAVWNKGKVRG